MQSFAKIRNSETTFIESSVRDLNINHGVYIDIFPFDGYRPQNKIRNFINSKRYALYNIQIAKKYTISYMQDNIKTKILSFISNWFYGTKTITDLLKKKDKIAKKYRYDQSKYVCSYSYGAPPPEKHYIRRECLGEGTTKIFEGIKINVPENHDALLKNSMVTI